MTALKVLRRGWVACPDAFVVAVISAFLGLSAFIYPPQSVVSTLVRGVQLVWAGAYLIGGVLRLTGILTQLYKVEGAGCLLLAGAGVVYGGTVIAVVGVRGIVPALAFIGIAAASLTRWVEILRIARRATRKTKEAS
jgi:hypothetical protein